MSTLVRSVAIVLGVVALLAACTGQIASPEPPAVTPAPLSSPTPAPTAIATSVPPATSASPVAAPAATSTPAPLPTPTLPPTSTPAPTNTPALVPTATPLPAPTATPTRAPTATPAPTPTPDPCAGIIDSATRAACAQIFGGSATPSSLADAAALLLARVKLLQGSEIYGARDPFPAGSTLTIQPDKGDALSVRVTDTAFFFLIDDAPGMRFTHPVRYVVVDGNSVKVSNREWLPVVNGIEWELDTPVVVLGISQGATIKTLRRATSASILTAPVAFSLPESSPALAAPPQAQPAKIALIIIDGNEFQRKWYDPAARQFANDADDMASTLRAQGYDVRRYSGYKGNILPSADATSVEKQLQRLKDEVRPGDEVVLFISAHGDPSGFAMYTKEGERSFLSYQRVGELVKGLDGGARVRVVIDACKSGGAVPYLAGRANITVVPAADDKTDTPVGLGSDPSFTHRIVLAAKDKSADANGDGKVDEGEALTLAQKQHAAGISARLVVKPPPGPPAPAPVPSVGPAPAPEVAPPGPAMTSTSGATPFQFTAPLVLPAADAGKPYLPNGQPFSFCDPPTVGFTQPCGPIPATRNPNGGSPPYHFQYGTAGGFPPFGMALGKDGQLTGTPNEATAGKTYRFTVCAVDLKADFVCRDVSLTVNGSTPTPTPTPTPTTPSVTITSASCIVTNRVRENEARVDRGVRVYHTKYYFRYEASGTATGPVGARLGGGPSYTGPQYGGSRTLTSGWTGQVNDLIQMREAGNPETTTWHLIAEGTASGPEPLAYYMHYQPVTIYVQTIAPLLTVQAEKAAPCP